MTATVDLFHTVLGPSDGAPLLLVHGWGGDGREWSPHADALAAAGHRVIVPDLRGHGRSPVPDRNNTPAAMTSDLAALLSHLGTGPVVAVGHSMGGQVVNLLAVHHPNLVRSVVALDPAHGAHGAELQEIPRRLAAYRSNGARAAVELVEGAFAPTAPPGLRTAHIRTMLGTPDHVIAQAYAGMYTDPGAVGIRPDSEGYLRLRACPALTVWTSEEAAEWERGTLQTPDSQVDHWTGTGHYLHEEHPRRTIQLIGQWAARRTKE